MNTKRAGRTIAEGVTQKEGRMRRHVLMQFILSRGLQLSMSVLSSLVWRRKEGGPLNLLSRPLSGEITM
jgi:hypothetical protein